MDPFFHLEELLLSLSTWRLVCEALLETELPGHHPQGKEALSMRGFRWERRVCPGPWAKRNRHQGWSSSFHDSPKRMMLEWLMDMARCYRGTGRQGRAWVSRV